jgi:hypothetical protein
MTAILKIFSLLVIVFCCFILFVFGTFILGEGYNPIKPGIDTKYAEKYDEAKFNNIQIGSDTLEIIGLLGQPLNKQELSDSTMLWYYTTDGKCKWMDFAWIGRELIINKFGKVKSINKPIHYD